jgi:hypothetical protein
LSRTPPAFRTCTPRPGRRRTQGVTAACPGSPCTGFPRFGFGGLLLLLATQHATAAAPKIISITPPCATRGASTVLTIRGTDLQGATLFVSGSGLSLGKPLSVQDGVRVRLTASAGADVGPQEIRAASQKGISQPAPVWIGVFPQRAEVEPNDDPVRPEPPSRGTVSIYGRIDRPGDRDTFSFEGRAGETWVVDCATVALGSPLFAEVHIVDPDGSEVPLVQSGPRVDTARIISLPKDGRYAVVIRGSDRESSSEGLYLCSIGRAPVVQDFTPHGEKPGRTIGLEIRGANLGATSRAAVRVPAETEVASWQSVKTDNGPSLPFLFPVADLPAVAITETDQTMSLPLVPAALEGKFEAYGVARFFYDLKGGDNLGFALYTSELGSAAKAVMRILDEDGRVLAGDGKPGEQGVRCSISSSTDRRIVFEVRNTSNSKSPLSFYRLLVEKEVPGFRVTAPGEGIILKAGGQARLPVSVRRLGGFSGPVEVVAGGLPAGITAERSVVSPSQGSAELVITAARSASVMPFLLKLVGRGSIGGGVVAQPVRFDHGATGEVRRTRMLPVVIAPPNPGSGRK